MKPFLTAVTGQKILVSRKDFPLLRRLKWYVDGAGYPYAGRVRLHLLLGIAKPGETCDHKNGNKLDGSRSNLRPATRQQQLFNTRPRKGCASKYKGVSRSREGLRWRAYTTLDGKQKSLGVFSSERAAALAYNKAAKKLFGRFARLNPV